MFYIIFIHHNCILLLVGEENLSEHHILSLLYVSIFSGLLKCELKVCRVTYARAGNVQLTMGEHLNGLFVISF